MRTLAVMGLLACLSGYQVARGADSPKATAAGPAKVIGKESAEQGAARRGMQRMTKMDMSRGEAPPAAPSTAITLDGLKSMLEGMGYEPKINTYDNGYQECEINYSRGTYSVYLTFNLSESKTNFWMGCYLCQLPETSKVPADKALEIVATQNAAWPAYFSYFPQNKNLYLNQPLKNDGIKPAVLKTTIDQFVDTIVNTFPAWDVSKWTTATAAPPAAPAPPSAK